MQIQLQNLIPKNTENSYFYQNGLSKVIPRLTLKVQSDIETCYELWNKFSTNESFFDLWDLRYAWYKGYKCKPYFYTLYENNKPLALLPLWYDDAEKRYEAFGSWYMEDNRIFTEDPRFVDLVFKVAPAPVFINSIKLPELDPNSRYNRYLNSIQPDDPKNIKDISSYKSIEDYLGSLKKKHRYNLRADYNKIQSLNPRVIIRDTYNEKSLKTLIALNKQRFNGQERDKSDFFEEGGEDVIHNTVQNKGLYKTKLIEVYIKNELIAVDLVAQYGGVYYLMIGGNKVAQYKGIGNYMLYIEFEDAIREGNKQVDCFQIDYGWKHRYFDQQEAYKLER